jgi:probable HAF family extracellular repeat protein
MKHRIIGSVALTALAACALANESKSDRSSSKASAGDDNAPASSATENTTTEEGRPATCATARTIGDGFDDSHTGATAHDINERGDVAGLGFFADGSVHAFFWSGGEMKDLGTLGGKQSRATALNDRAEVIGSSEQKESNGSHAVRWSDGHIEDLGTFGGTFSDALDINERGSIVGYASTAAGQSHAFLWRDGVMTDLGTLGGLDSAAYRINARGQILGWSTTKVGGQHAVLWDDGVIRDLGPTTATAFRLNARGDAIFGGRPSPYFWSEGVTTEILPAGAIPPIEALDLNDRGQVAVAARNEEGRDEAFVWRTGAAVRIETGASPGFVSPLAINLHGQVAGFAGGRAFSWKDGKLTWLAPDDVNSSAVGLNDRGQVIGHVGTTAKRWDVHPCRGDQGPKDAGPQDSGRKMW